MTTNLRLYLLHNCENYQNIDFLVINKDHGNWVKWWLGQTVKHNADKI